MSRKKIQQQIYYRSFRFTSKDKLFKDFLNSLNNTNSFLKSMIVSSKRYSNYIKEHDIRTDGVVLRSYNV